MSKSPEAKFVVISVMGSHAGENEDEIFDRKIEEIEVSRRTFWLIKSYKAKPDMVQTISSQANMNGENVHCIFIEPSSAGGSVPTKSSNSAKMYSSDKLIWSEFPKVISQVTGKIDGNAYALVLNELKLVDSVSVIDLWDYADFFNPSKPLKIMQGASTLCAVKKDMRRHHLKKESNLVLDE